MKSAASFQNGMSRSFPNWKKNCGGKRRGSTCSGWRDLIADDFTEFGRSGRVYTKEGILAIRQRPLDTSLPLPDFHVRPLSTDVALVTYNSEITNDGVKELARQLDLDADLNGLAVALSSRHAVPRRELNFTMACRAAAQARTAARPSAC